jgi:hypothetical protein
MPSPMKITMCLLAASTAFALTAPARADTGDLPLAVGQLSDPATARPRALAVAGMTRAMLDVRVDGISQAVDQFEPGYQGYDRPQTMGELIAPNDPYLDRRIQAQTEKTAVMAGRAAKGIAVAVPQFDAMARQFKQSFKRSLKEMDQP